MRRGCTACRRRSGSRELAMFRGSYSFNLFNQYRIDLFVDHARGRGHRVRRSVAAGDWAGARPEPARAAQHHPARGSGPVVSAGELSRRRLDRAADPAAQAAMMSRCDLSAMSEAVAVLDGCGGDPAVSSRYGCERDADESTDRVMRADLHVHSYHSGYASHLRFLRARDCYSEPEAVYRVAKARGMDCRDVDRSRQHRRLPRVSRSPS